MTTEIPPVSSAFLYGLRLHVGFTVLKPFNSSLHLNQHGHEHHVDLVRDGDYCSRVCVHPCIVEYLIEPLAVIGPQLSAKGLPLCTLDVHSLSECPDCTTHLNQSVVCFAPKEQPKRLIVSRWYQVSLILGFDFVTVISRTRVRI